MSQLKTRKTLIINRAVPGSGKTTISNCIFKSLDESGVAIALHSTDEYFMTKDGRYNFDVTKLYRFHQLNYKELLESLKRQVDVVICDNVNLSPWQTKAYTDAARKYNYFILFITFKPREISKHVQSQIVTAEKPDAHGVPEEIILSMIEEYHAYNNLFDKTIKPDIKTQEEYCWDMASDQKISTGKPSQHFDSDAVIEILPHQYREIQTHIGEDILKIIASSGLKD